MGATLKSYRGPIMTIMTTFVLATLDSATLRTAAGQTRALADIRLAVHSMIAGDPP